MWVTLIFSFVAICFWLIFRFHEVLFILFITIILATVIRPIVTWMNRRKLPRNLGVMIVFTLLFVLFIGIFVLLVPLIFEQGSTIVSALPGYYQTLREWILTNPNQLIMSLSKYLPVALPGFGSAQQTGEQMMAIAGQAPGFLSAAARTVFIATSIFLLIYHWTLDGPRSILTLLLLVPKGKREEISQLIDEISTRVVFYVGGQGILCLAIGGLALIAYLIIGLPNALILALVAGILEAVPLIGPLLGAIPAGIIALSISPSKLIWVIVATLVIQQMENIFLVPRVMRKAVGVNPFVSLLSIFAFSSLFGIVGALMAIPIAAIIQILLDHFIFNPSTIEPDIPGERDLVNRLRYEAQDLAQDLRKQGRITTEGSEDNLKQIDQVMDEIEAITTDLDELLAEARLPEVP